MMSTGLFQVFSKRHLYSIWHMNLLWHYSLLKRSTALGLGFLPKVVNQQLSLARQDGGRVGPGS